MHLRTNATIGPPLIRGSTPSETRDVIESEVRFIAEHDRFIRLLLAEVSAHREADFLYYPPGQASALYHWSSTEGTLHPYQTVTG